MGVVNIIPKVCKLFPGVTSAVLHLGMTLVAVYHSFCGNVVINTSFEKAQGIERVANFLLMPTQYLCDGKVITLDGNNHFEVKRRFQYSAHKKIYSPLSLTFFTPGLILGGTIKGIALLNPEVKKRHLALKAHFASTEVVPELDYYREVGIDVTDWQKGEKCISQGYKRGPGAENHLAADKEGLKAIITLLTEAKIPFWVDCGTCIGVYRHGGIIPWDNDLDISVLINDFQNVRNVLKQLNPKKFASQDWSGRNSSGNYIRVYIKESHNHIDIYHNAIDPIGKTVTYIIAHQESHFMAQDWKEREKRQSHPIPFDVIFPLKRGMLDGIEVPVPNQTARFIQYKYGPNIDPPRLYNEKSGRYEKDLSHPYWNVPLAH
ncbi:MAG: LicD family protein [Chlamydiia bacterium]|nr:LicD family protein [Chlamydiia bacterium]